MLKDAGRIAAYAFAKTATEGIAYSAVHGPCIWGIDWYEGFDSPDVNGVVHPTGSVRGGHCIYDCGTKLIRGLMHADFMQSWGKWGIAGHFYVPPAELETVFAANGEALAAIEKPLL